MALIFGSSYLKSTSFSFLMIIYKVSMSTSTCAYALSSSNLGLSRNQLVRRRLLVSIQSSLAIERLPETTFMLGLLVTLTVLIDEPTM